LLFVTRPNLVWIGAGLLGALFLGVWALGSRASEGSPVTLSSMAGSARSAPAPPPERPGEISSRSLLRELVDLGALARLPEPPYEARFASSYDRRSVTPNDSEGWFANDDWASAERANYLRVEQKAGRTEYVLFDAKGPGAVVRLWSASPAGTLRFYFDGSERAELEEPFDELLSGRGSLPEPFAYVAAKGRNSYFPLAFRKSLKITTDSLVSRSSKGTPRDKLYYQVQYRAYPEALAERVRTFAKEELAFVSADPRAARVFEEPWKAYEASPRASRHQFSATEGGLQVSLETAGGAAVRELVVIVAQASDAALRRARLRASFDGEKTIDVPLGDFFGAAPGVSPYDTLPFTVRADGSFTCRFAMPFRERAVLEVVGSPGASAELILEPEPWSERSLYFHARSRPPASVQSQPPRDLPMLKLEGQGVYVGDAFNIDNPAQRWWGEGDDKIYVDGEEFPRCFGTGTEDYYGYAWSTTEVFSRALHAQPRTSGPDFFGQISNNRFRTLDAIPFQRAFRFDLELWHWESARVRWDATTYFYARPGVRVLDPP